MAVPKGLEDALRAFAMLRRELSARQSVSSDFEVHDARLTPQELAEAFDLYVSGDADFIRFLRKGYWGTREALEQHYLGV